MSQIITRAVIEPTDESTVFTAASIKPFKSAFNTLVSHMTYTASQDSVSVFDSDGNRIATLALEEPLKTPIQILKSTLISDPTFFVLY